MIIKNTNKSHEILLTYHNGVSGFYKQLSKTDTVINAIHLHKTNQRLHFHLTVACILKLPCHLLLCTRLYNRHFYAHRRRLLL
jgi:hypothetical protein